MECRREDDDDDELSFSNELIDCCVSIVDMVGSTRITAEYSSFTQNRKVLFDIHQ